LFFVSCETTNQDPRYDDDYLPPLHEEFIDIYLETYILHENDCSNKCSKYARLLTEKGYEANLVIMYHPDSEYNHVVVSIVDKGKKRYLDPTNLFFGDQIFDYSEYIEKKWYNKKDYGKWLIIKEIPYIDRLKYKDGKEFVEYTEEQ